MKDLSLTGARTLHKKAGFSPYKGGKLAGERCELDASSSLFPVALSRISDPPKKLYVVGDPSVLQEGLAVIGARKATPYGLSCAEHFAGIAAARGVIVISGGALGCDSAAHKAALAVGGRTLVFLGGGCDELYPASNFDLFQRIILEGGALVSEYSWNYPPLKHTFRARNRLIAGLSKATLIVEASLPSGTFSTADEALSANREVLVVPGSINSPTSKGANRLLYQGATPVVDDDSFEDVLFSLFGILKQENFIACGQASDHEKYSRHAQKLYAGLCAQPMRMDEIMEAYGSKASTQEKREVCLLALTELQQMGKVTRYPDGRYGAISV